MSEIIQNLTAYYGLDWAGMTLGLIGMYLITCQNRFGFLFSAIGCVTGITVAAMSDQTGYIVYNAIILLMASRTFITWPRKQVIQA